MKKILLLGFTFFVLSSLVALMYIATITDEKTTQTRASEQAGAQVSGQTMASTSTSFLETFDGLPAQPQPYKTIAGSDNWDTFISFRDFHDTEKVTGIQFPPVDAHHGPNCEKPVDANGNLVTHAITSGVNNHVFICNNHMMTSMNGGAYGAIYMMPNHMVDFSTGESIIRFDMTTFRTSGRDWVDFWITPFENQLLAPLERWRPDFNGEPKEGIQIVMDSAGSATPFRTEFNARKITNYGYPGIIRINTKTPQLENFVTTSPVRRDTWEIRISKTRLKFSMFINRGAPPALNAVPDVVFVDDPIPGGLAWSQGVFQLGHHSYNPTKDCGTSNHQGFKPCGPGTWHWDNVSISPSKPFTIIKSNKDVHNIMTASRSTFKSVAPTNAFLRFQGFDSSTSDIEVSYNEGASWIAAIRQPGSVDVSPTNTSVISNSNNRGQYFMPIPVGTKTVLFRGKQESNWGAWVHNPAIVSLTTTASTGPTVAPLPTATTAPTAPTSAPQPTVLPPTPTAQPSPTRAPTSVPTPTTLSQQGIIVKKTITKFSNGNLRTQFILTSTRTQRFFLIGRMINFDNNALLKQQMYQNRTISPGIPLVINMDVKSTLTPNQIVATAEVFTYHSTQ
jgi:hypothetical protein